MDYLRVSKIIEFCNRYESNICHWRECSSSFFVYLHQMTRRSDGIKFQIGIRRARKHTHTWIILSSSFQLRRSTNADDDDWHTDCVVAVSNLHSFVYKQQKKRRKLRFALRSYVRMDRTQQDDHPVSFSLPFFWLLPIHDSMCNSRNLTSSILYWKHILSFSDDDRTDNQMNEKSSCLFWKNLRQKSTFFPLITICLWRF